ncbi:MULTISPECIES: hypothetical protein [unclassified Kribbella]|uniref:hypothetical protein n=1 Tax=unclassified Kribbella TaxID=2644121 RepID=UPI0033DCC2E6
MATVAAVAIVASVPTVAAAGVDTPTAEISSSDCPALDNLSAHGRFVAYGDSFWVYDDCADGHSAQLQVDIEPFGASGHFDWKFTTSNGDGSYKKVQFDLHEGTAVTVRVCISEGSVAVACGRWETGMA